MSDHYRLAANSMVEAEYLSTLGLVDVVLDKHGNVELEDIVLSRPEEGWKIAAAVHSKLERPMRFWLLPPEESPSRRQCWEKGDLSGGLHYRERASLPDTYYLVRSNAPPEIMRR